MITTIIISSMVEEAEVARGPAEEGRDLAECRGP